MLVADSSMEKKVKKISKEKKLRVLLVSQDVKFVRCLAGNDKKARDKALKALQKYFAQRPKTQPFSEEDFTRIWKGLFYSMWMSDKPLIQEECAENISKLVHFERLEDSLMFFKAGLVTLQNEWFGIDQLRLDKFLMLVRRLLRQGFVILKNHHYTKKTIEAFNKVLEETVLNTKVQPPSGLLMHFLEIYLEELAKVSNGKLNPERTTDFLMPFIRNIAFASDRRHITYIQKYIFTFLIKQHDLAMEYQAKYEVWRSQGFPGSINSIQKVKVSDDKDLEYEQQIPAENDENKPLDPRAGRVDVEISQIKFHPKVIAEELLKLKSDPKTNSGSRKTLTHLAEQFKSLAKGVFPLGAKRIESKKYKSLDNYDTNIRKAAKRLIKFENSIMGKNNKKNRKRKRTEENEENGVQGKKRKMEKSDSKEIKNHVQEKRDKSEKRDNGKIKEKKLKVQEMEKSDMIEIKNDVQETRDKTEKRVNGKIKEKKLKVKEVAVVSSKIRPKKVKKLKQSRLFDPKDVEYIFKRNSGIWFVVKEDEKIETPEKVFSSQKSNGSPSKNDLNPVKLFESPEIPPDPVGLFPSSSWDEPLQEGEYEICIPAKRYMKKLKKSKKKNVEDTIVRQLRGKSVFSTPKNTKKITDMVEKINKKSASGKKVRINTKLNVSQEVHEHITQVISSPQIPFDSSKKPGKPLLKTPVKSTPINPFYKLRT